MSPIVVILWEIERDSQILTTTSPPGRGLKQTLQTLTLTLANNLVTLTALLTDADGLLPPPGGPWHPSLKDLHRLETMLSSQMSACRVTSQFVVVWMSGWIGQDSEMMRWLLGPVCSTSAWWCNGFILTELIDSSCELGLRLLPLPQSASHSRN